MEIDCRPLRGPGGTVDYFISFEREVTRRLGRPASGMTGRYEPISVSNNLLTQSMLAIGIFQHGEAESISQ